ncbi:MAG: bifunctional glutamate N-acetyltransferase/amino-acid acetyltransferase ArgJ [Verrucomicrobia bacterium]|nr:bifunctional glutamate N-acetyltransferase/amino-acid acetyltransferase ArgJ [Verrucomicrobiota bacterium]
MQSGFESVEGSVVAPLGFLAGGVFCDIKRLGTGKGSAKGQKRDLALIVSEAPAAAAGMFTTNQVCAAPVKLCLDRVSRGMARAIVVNSGNANACTGRRGLEDAEQMAAAAARALGLTARQVLVASTGRIGVNLPMNRVRAGIKAAAQCLGKTATHAAAAAEAILTSDTRAKQVALEFRLGGRIVRVGGICKGAGMIQPGMSRTGRRPAAAPRPKRHATMLAFLTTDAAVEVPALQRAIEEAVAQSFNRITVDGDMSTNDTVLLLANGQAGNAPLTVRAWDQPRSPRAQAAFARRFQAALNQVCLDLAQQIVRDGEGVSRFVTVRVTGAKNDRDAEAAARAVANSALVKTSWCGGDPNWGRIMDALGYSPAKVVEGKVDIGYSAAGSGSALWSLKGGQPTRATFGRLCKIVAAKEFDLHIRLHLGRGSAVLYAADLTEQYVEFNQGDVNDPAALGG